MNQSEIHSDLVKRILAECGALAFCRLWKNDTGMAISMDGARKLRYGLKGSADILGIGNGGRFIAIECKTGSARLKAHQENFRLMIEKFGGIHITARSKSLEENVLVALEIKKILTDNLPKGVYL